MLARATVRNTGSKPVTAMRVAGSEPLNITTPVRPLSQPLVVLSIVNSCVLPFMIPNGWRKQRQSYTISTNCYGFMSGTVGENHGWTGRCWHAHRKGDGKCSATHRLAQPRAGRASSIGAGSGEDHAGVHLHHRRGLRPACGGGYDKLAPRLRFFRFRSACTPLARRYRAAARQGGGSLMGFAAGAG
ncbi:hypothetical protein D3C78_1356490 [compost metagenome]